jgi:hypothetical protein
MSVQSEYSRALESLLADLRNFDDPSTARWVEALEDARPGRASDLTSAAKDCLKILEAIDATRKLAATRERGPEMNGLRRPFLNLRAHCCAILGIPDASAD